MRLFALILLFVVLPAQARAQAQTGGFDLVAFFSQPTSGPGRSVAVNGIDRWRVSTRATRRGGTIRMKERFRYADGSRRLQDWTIRRAETARGGRAFTATRPDLQGPAVFRPAGPNRIRYVWHQYLNVEEKRNVVTLRGLLTLRPDGTMLNTATVWKWFLPIGRVRVVFRPEGG